MKKLSLFLALLSAPLLSANTDCKQPLPICSFLPKDRPCIIDSCRLNQSDVYLKLSVLYWVAQENGLDYALKNQQSQFDAKMKLYQPKFTWEPAFRALIGCYLPHDGWKLDFSYSFFIHHIDQTTKHLTSNVFGDGLLAVWTAPGAFLSGNIYARWRLAETKWKIHANFFDAMLRNALFAGKALSFEPSFGIKMAILQQRFQVNYSLGNTYTTPTITETYVNSKINMKNRSFNIGPSFAMQSRWCLSPHWNLSGSLGGSLLASQFHVGRNEFDVSTTTSTQIGSYRFNHDYWTWRPQASLLFGIEWGDCVCRKKSVIHYGFKASYEMQYYWKQNMMLRHTDAPIVQSQIMSPSQGDLAFQGLSVDIFFDF